MNAARLRGPDSEPQTRVGNCSGCNTWPLTLFKIPGVYQYRCAGCFERETGYRHHLSLAPPRAAAGQTLSQLEPVEAV